MSATEEAEILAALQAPQLAHLAGEPHTRGLLRRVRAELHLLANPYGRRRDGRDATFTSW